MEKVDCCFPIFYTKYCKREFFLLALFFSISFGGFSSTHPSIDTYGQHSFNSLSCVDFIDTSFIELTIENCDNMAVVCIQEVIANMLTYSITDNGQPYIAGVSPCDFDTSYAYTYGSIPGAGTAGPYLVDSWAVDGNVYAGTVANMADLTDSMNVWDMGGDWSHDSFTATIRGGNTAVIYGAINITQIATGDSGVLLKNTTLNPTGSRISLDTGYHELIFTEPIENCTDTLIVVVNCIPCEELYTGPGTFELDNCNDSQAVCVDIPENTFSAYTVSDNGSAYNGSMAPCSTDSLFSSIEILLDTGYHEIVFYNTTNQCVDSFDLTVNCAPCPEYLGGTIINIMAAHCDSIAGICLAVPFLEINNYTVSVNGNLYAGGFSLCNLTDTEIHLDTGTYQVLLAHNISGCLDSATIIVDCVPEVFCTDFINETFATLQSNDCSTTVELCVEIPFIEMSDYTLSDNNLPFTGDILDCDPGTALALTPGFHELIFTHDTTQCADTISSLVACISPENVDFSIIASQTDTICLDTTQLPGVVISMNNLCEENSGELAIVSLDAQSNCAIIEGIEEGTAQACVEICDSYGFCDTTFINIEIIPLVITEPGLSPIANDDYAQTAEGVLVNIAVLANDAINGTVNSLGILEAPQHGSATIRNDNLIEYIPDPGFCTPTMSDSFSYVLCNEVDCSQATVYVRVNCENIFVYNGFSPNGDGMNEYFVINGADTNPANTLSVFNRWGGRVFFQKGYQNNWDGTWDGLDLPDATYFYYFEDGNGSTAAGYVLIQR